ncbi:MAG: ATP-binding cassette domain-containing protein [Lachnospiraceae bacterium]|nr:ATP-binding cassette domain-containing protein [Lachnospiraceae bacterium]
MSEIKIRHLTKRFEAEGHTLTALDDVNLTIGSGSIYGIIGMSGAGKSTLVRSINYLEKPTEGSVFIDDTDLAELSPKELRKKRANIGMIFQGFNLLEQKNVIDNVTLPLKIAGTSKKEAREKARALLRTVGLEDKERAYPSRLSGGQKQRVAIARALATDPQILLCDEATSALDPQTSKSILDLLKEINTRLGITIVVITHQMSVVTEICDRVAIVENGRIVEEGSVDEIFTSPKTDAARELISGKKDSFSPVDRFDTGNVVRIVFSENSAFEPVIANTILKFNTPINILKADTRNVNGQAKGEMLLGLPEDEDLRIAIMEYIKERGLSVTEVKDHA